MPRRRESSPLAGNRANQLCVGDTGDPAWPAIMRATIKVHNRSGISRRDCFDRRIEHRGYEVHIRARANRPADDKPFLAWRSGPKITMTMLSGAGLISPV